MENSSEDVSQNTSPLIIMNDQNQNQIADQESSLTLDSSSKISHPGILKISPQSLHNQKFISKRMLPEISPGFPSQQISPINFTFPAEMGQSNLVHKTLSAHLEDSQSFTISQFDNEVGPDTNNLNTRIARILTDSKNELEQKESIDANSETLDQDDPLRLSKKRKKLSSRVTFDDSLNTDLLYYPGVSSAQPSKNGDLIKERNKRTHFISVYSNRQISSDGEDEKGQTRSRFKSNSSVDHKSLTLKENEYEDDRRTQSLFEEPSSSKTDQSGSRLSKLTEDQAALIFEKRKNHIFKGLKKLNKNRSFHVSKSISTPSQSASKSSKFTENKSEIVRPLSMDDSSAAKQKVANLLIDSAEKQKSPKDQTPKSNRTPQKASKQNLESNSRSKKNNTTEASRRSRSLSPVEVRSAEPATHMITKQNLLEGKRMIDEMFKLAREDVQKRIASIDKRLIESGNYISNGSSRADNEPADNKSKLVDTQVNNPAVIAQDTKALPQTPEKKHKTLEKTALSERLKVTPESDKIQPESDRVKSQDATKKDAKVSKKQKAATPPLVKQLPPKTLITAANSKMETPEKDKGVIKLNTFKTEKAATAAKDHHTQSLMKKASLQALYSTEGIISNVEKKLEQQYGKQSGSKPSSPMKIGGNNNNTTVKFADLEKNALEKNSYSRIHATDKERRANTNMSLNISTNPGSRSRIENELTPQKKKPEQESMRTFIETLKKVETNFKNQVLRESSEFKKTVYTKPKQTAENEMIQSTEYFLRQERNASKENNLELGKKDLTKRFMLRPQSTEKTHQRRISSNIVSSKPLENNSRIAFNSSKVLNDKSTVKEPKITMPDAVTPPIKGSRLPRSQSDTNIKKPINEKLHKNMMLEYFDDKNHNERYKDELVSSTKHNKGSKQITPKSILPDSTKNEKASSRKSPLRSFVYDGNRPNSPKGDYFKNLFSAIKRIDSDKKSPVSQQKFDQNDNNYLYVTIGENVEDIVKQNYKLLGIKNNQYVFLSN